MDEEDQDIPIVIDNGSGILKAGFGGDDVPRVTFRSVVGRKHVTGIMAGFAQQSYIGDEAVDGAKKGTLSLISPFENGFVKNWDDMVWHGVYTFKYRQSSLCPSKIG